MPLLDVYDKTIDLPFKTIRFVSLEANRPILQSYKMILSQIYPIPYLCNDINKAKDRIDFLINQVVANGFHKRRLLPLVQKFIQKNPFRGALLNTIRLADCLRYFLLYILMEWRMVDTPCNSLRGGLPSP